METYDREAWQRLGKLVRRQRKRVGFENSNDWAAAVGRSSRVLLGLERGEKTGEDTLGRVEQLLGWAEDSCQRVLDGGEPTLASEDRPAGPSLSVVPTTVVPVPPSDEDNEVLAAIRRDPDLDATAREHFLNQYLILRDFSRFRRGDSDLLPYVAHGKRTGEVDVEEERRLEELAKQAARDNPNSPYRDRDK